MSYPVKYTERIEALLAAARAAGGGDSYVLAVVPGPNLFYLTGLSFHLGGRPTVAFFPIPKGDRPILVLPELEAAKAAAGAVEFGGVFTYSDAAGPAEAFRAAAERLSLSSRTVGVEGRRIRFMELELLRGARAIENADRIFAEPRLRKDPGEIAALRRAVAIVERALGEALGAVRPGATEEELAREMALQLLRAGSAPEFPFQPFAATGENGAFPHAVPGARPLLPGHLLTLDLGAAAGGYFSDITRTFAIGGAPVAPELLSAYDAVRRANAAGRAAVRPGATGHDVDCAARAEIERAGFGKYFTHRTGHGLGLEAHETPEMKQGEKLALEPGMVFTIEPGVYLPGLGGVRIEDDVIVTAAGGESMTTLNRELETLRFSN